MTNTTVVRCTGSEDKIEEENEERVWRGADGTEAEQEGKLRSRSGATDTEDTKIEEDTDTNYRPATGKHVI